MPVERAGAGAVWDCRAAWATGAWISLRLSGDPDRLEGYVQEVAASGAFVMLDPEDGGECWHVPAGVILATFKPHFAEGGTGHQRRVSRVLPAPEGQMGLVAPLDVSARATGAMLRAAAALLPEDVLLTLQALDQVPRRATVPLIAEQLGRSEAWARARLRILEAQALVVRHRRSRKPDIWIVG